MDGGLVELWGWGWDAGRFFIGVLEFWYGVVEGSADRAVARKPIFSPPWR